MRKRKTFMKTGKTKITRVVLARNLRLRRLKRHKHKLFERQALQFISQD